MFVHLIVHALVDSAKMVPFLFAAYWLIEYIEHRHSAGIERALAGGGRFGFVPGTLLGLLPQCGFSAMAANFYSSKVITLGTLLAVFLSTSDEAVPLLIANPEHWKSLGTILLIKLCIALTAGFLIDFVFRGMIPVHVRGGYTGSMNEVDCHEHEEEDGILVAALKHTLHIFVFILIFNFVLGSVVHLVGEDVLGAFLEASGPFQPLLAGLVGLIPNCMSSVLITQLYAAGRLSLGGVIAGLCTGAGVGLAVLFRTNKSMKQNFFIVGLLYAIGVAGGYLFGLLA